MDKLICVGKNYFDHAKELGDAVPEAPVLFLKPPSALVRVPEGVVAEAPLPRGRGAVHHECEIVARIGQDGSVEAVTLGLDMTLREVQAKLKKAGHPWEISKVFPGSAIVGPWIEAARFPGFLGEPFELRIGGSLRQSGRGVGMRFGVEECLAYASASFPVVAGDLLFTGTPAGVGPVEPGDEAELRWGDRLRYRVRWT